MTFGTFSDMCPELYKFYKIDSWLGLRLFDI